MCAGTLNRYQLFKLIDRQYPRQLLMGSLVLAYKSVRCRSGLSSLPAVNMRFELTALSKRLQVNPLKEQRIYSTVAGQKLEQFGGQKKSQDSAEQQSLELSRVQPFKSAYHRYTGGVAFLVSKHPLMQRLKQPKWSILQTTNANMYGLDTYESNLRHTRAACPIKLKLPDYASDKYLNISQRYRPRLMSANSQYANKLTTLARKYRPVQNTRQAASTTQIKKLLNATQTVNQLDIKPNQRVELGEQRVPQPIIQTNKKQSNNKTKQNEMHSVEKQELNNLLGDILQSQRATEQVAHVREQIMKTSPLFKLVTQSLESRFNLRDRTFDKQLVNPMMFRHPLAKYVRPAGINRRSIYVRATPITGYRAENTPIRLPKFLSDEPDE